MKSNRIPDIINHSYLHTKKKETNKILITSDIAAFDLLVEIREHEPGIGGRGVLRLEDVLGPRGVLGVTSSRIKYN